LLNDDNDVNIKLQQYNKMNGIIKGHFGKHDSIDKVINAATFNTPLCFGSENWLICSS
jgi:hypothetical protein